MRRLALAVNGMGGAFAIFAVIALVLSSVGFLHSSRMR
jgi:hypothetical protein